MKNAAPDEWRDIKTTEPNQHPVSIKTLTNAQLEAIASGVDPADVGVTGTLECDFERLKG